MTMRSPRHSREGERGAVLVNFAIVLFPMMCGFTVAALALSRESTDRREVQSAADAMALTAAHSLEQLGTQGPFQLTDATTPKVLAPRNVRSTLPVGATFTVHRFPEEHRALVEVVATAQFDSQQAWFKKRLFNFEIRAYGQVNENVYGDKWPAMVIAIDSSQSMGFPILGSATTPAFTIVQQAVLAYASNTLPVRNGVVVFNTNIGAMSQPPPPGNVNNLQPIQDLFKQDGTPIGLTNAKQAIDKARTDLANSTGLQDGRNLIFISDGEPTAGPCGANQDPCHFTESVQAASQLRNLPDAGTALFTLEIRRSNYWTAVTDFMHQISGGPLTAGNDPMMSFSAQSQLGIQQFITGLTRSICAFGPLDPDPLTPIPTDDVLRIRQPNPHPEQDPRRVFAFIREQSGVERPIPFVLNRDLTPAVPGFEYATNAKGSFVILTLASCNELGADSTRRLVVRWDDPQLVQKPHQLP